MNFTGKTIFVTGSTRGIGAAAAEMFLEQGGSVILHGRLSAQVEAAITRLGNMYPARVRGFPADLGDRGQCRSLASQAGEIDVLVNCAGIFKEASIADTDLGIWDDTLDVNLTAAWTLSQALLVPLRRRKGTIVNVASDAALLGYAGCVAYCASKGALAGLTRALATELAPDVRVLCVCPGSTETDMMRASVVAAPDEAKAREQWASYSMLRRFADPREIGEAILFAASPLASFQTGSLIVIDGGTTAGKRV